MPPVVERETTVTRTVQGADQLKQNLSLIASEIQKVRDQAQSEVGTLERIRSMLDVGYLNDLLKTVTNLQERIRTLEGESFGAGGEVDRLRHQLREEQARLEKLWDAYKAQEDELARLKRDHPVLEEKLFERERQIDSLRREVARLEPYGRFKSQAEQMERDNHALRSEVEHLQGDLRRGQDAMRALERETQSLRALGPLESKARDLEHQLEEERERLAKLYKVYEDMESAKKDLERRIKAWQEWFNRLQPALEQVCGATGGPANT